MEVIFMNKGKQHYVRWVVLALACVLLTTWLFRINVLFTSNHLSLTYARSATSSPPNNHSFYVHDNVLYFTKDGSPKDKLCYVKNNIIKTLTAERTSERTSFLYLHTAQMLSLP